MLKTFATYFACGCLALSFLCSYSHAGFGHFETRPVDKCPDGVKTNGEITSCPAGNCDTAGEVCEFQYDDPNDENKVTGCDCG